MKTTTETDFVSKLERVFKESAVRNMAVTTIANGVRIAPGFLNDRIWLDLTLIGSCSYAMCTIEDKTFYLIPILSASCLLMAIILADFLSVNKLDFDFLNKKLCVTNRIWINRPLMKFALKRSEIISFEQIQSFRARSNNNIRFPRAYIDLQLKSGIKYALLSFPNERKALAVSVILNSVLE